MAKKETKTNAMRMLKSAGISYTLHTYDVSDDLIDGVSVAKKCGEDPEQVFKTLVTVGNDKEHYVFAVPVAQKLDLKACAKAAGVKSVEMIPQKELLPLTGYIHVRNHFSEINVCLWFVTSQRSEYTLRYD